MNVPTLGQATVMALALVLFQNVGLSATGDSKLDRPPAPVFNDLGHHHHPVTTTSKPAQRYFDQGFTLLYGFNHNEAIRSFEGAAKIDPDCAMAYWGITYAYGPNINMPMLEPSVPKAWDALQKAMAVRDKASKKEQA